MQENTLPCRSRKLLAFDSIDAFVLRGDDANFDPILARGSHSQIKVVGAVIVSDQSGRLLEIFRLKRKTSFCGCMEVLQAPGDETLIENGGQGISSPQTEPAGAAREAQPCGVRRLAQGLKIQAQT